MKLFLLSVFSCLLLSLGVEAQNNSTVLNPNDVVTFLDASAPKPAVPANNNIIYKWYATKKISWNTTNYKPYIFNGLNFRLRFPKNYNPADTTKKYPLIVMLHGKGEIGDLYDNDLQLANGGQIHDNAIINNKFDGFIMFPQSNSEWGYSHYDRIIPILNIMAANANVDLDRVVVHGLSNGGAGTTGIIARYPKMFAAALPMSAIGGWANYDQVAYIPLWVAQGALDTQPTHTYTTGVINELRNRGANITYSLFPNLGHGVWNEIYNNADFFPYINRAHKANPTVFFGRTEFCPGDVVNVKLGLTPGFDGYQWRKDGVVIPTATTNNYQATQFGTYEARFRRGNVWSPWSPTPVVIKLKSATVSPTIKVAGINSHVLPAASGATSVTLEVPEGYTEYKWRKLGNATILSTTRQLVVSQPGEYVVQIKELYGCSSNDSEPFSVIAVNGSQKPAAVTSFNAQVLSKTEISLNWTDVANPQYNETAFEIYRSLNAGSGYKMIASVQSDSNNYTDSLLDADTKYYYIVRAINTNGASAVSTEVSATTLRDNNPPSAPGNVRITGVARNYIDIAWEASTDDIGVSWYDIYVNGQKLYSTESDNNTFRVGGLVYGNTYTIKVLAKDMSGNLSVASNQVTAKTANNGFSYKYYEGTWNVLPNFSTLTPVATGTVDDISLAIRGRDTNYAIVYEGFINIPVTGNYTFETYSDDGSKMYIGPYDFNATALVNNDGAHGAQYREGTVNLTAGTHPITVTYLQISGGYEMKLFWKNTAHGVVARQVVPKQFYVDNQTPLVKPAKVSNVNASAIGYDKINVSWIDNSNDETGFEIYRSNNILGPFQLAARVNANATSYIDENLTPQTNYFYKIKTVSNTGESDFAGLFQEYKLNFNNAFVDESSFNRNVAGVNGAAFSLDKKEGSHSLSLDGTNDYVNIGNNSTGGYLNTAFNSRTISFWYYPQLLTQTRILLDMGASSNGIALRTNLESLQLGIASNNVRRTLSTPVSLNTWYLITIVYNGNSLKLYKDGVLVASADDLAFTSILATTDGSRLGTTFGSNAFNANTSYYSKALIDAFTIYNGALSESEIQSLYTLNPIDAKSKTSVLPVAPTVPSNLVATSVSPKSIKVNWSVDNASYAPITYSIYRSANDTTNFVKVFEQETLSGELLDSGLVANKTYFYKIKAAHVGGESNLSNAVSAITKNTTPVLVGISNQTIRFDQISSLPLSASDADGDSITFSIVDSLAFASVEQLTANTAKINFNPTLESIGTYSVNVTAADNYGGVDTVAFNLYVSQNYKPSIVLAQTSLTVNEGAQAEVLFTGNDENEADSLSFSLGYQTPSFVTLVNTGDKAAKLVFNPTYVDAGNYNVYVKVDDQNNGIDSLAINLTVTDVNPGYKIYVNFAQNSSQGGYWNNANSPVNGKVFSNFKNDQLTTTPVGITVTSDWQNWWNNSGNNGVYSNALFPVDVTNTNWGVNNGTQTFNLTGLSSLLKYDLSFLSSSKYTSGNYNTTITSGSSSVNINSVNNTSQLVTLTGLRPNLSGEISVSVISDAGGTAHINALVLDGTLASVDVPAAPRDLIATYHAPTKRIKLNWTDAAFDETAYEVFRTDSTGSYSLVQQLSTNSTEYFDSEYLGNTQISYKVRAINEVGASLFSDSVSILTPNRIPSIIAIDNQSLAAGSSVELTIQANDDANDVLTITASNLPSFATLTAVSNGTSKLNINPAITDVGVYSGIVIQVVDIQGGIAKDTISITVINADEQNVKINFNYGQNAPNPWNNTNANPTAGLTLSDLKDANGNNTTLGVQLLSTWSGANNLGMTTGNNSGKYPDNVMNTFYYDFSGANKQVKITGLESTKRYSFIFYASWQNPWDQGTTRYTVGTTTVSLDPANNLSNTVQINNIAGNANGEAIINIERAPGGTFVFIGSLEINSNTYTGTPLAPTNLIATSKSKTSIQLNWQDQSDNEDGFAIYRSSSENGVYSVIDTTSASATSFTDNGLSANTIYWYKVKAVRSDLNNSNFSNISSVSTVAYAISINFNREDPAPAPWNNTNKNPEDGDRFNNLKDDSNSSTSISLTMIDNFTAANNLGVVTGSNSGKFPDVVNKWFYYSEKNETARIKLSGLNQTMAYDFEFFGSWFQPFANGNSSYTINGTKVLLNPANNINNTVSISNVLPNENGEIFIDIFMQPEAQYAFLNALIIKAHAANVNLNEISFSKTKSNLTFDSPIVLDSKVTAYPNPFIDYIHVDLGADIDRSAKLNLQLVDLSGKILKSESFNLDENVKNVILSLQEVNLQPGVYLLRLNNGKQSNILKVVRGN
jgi:chitodextrinase